MLQQIQLRVRLEPDVLSEANAQFVAGGQCLGLPAGAVQAHGTLAGQTLPKRVGGDQLIQLRVDRFVTPTGQLGIDPFLGGVQSRIGQPGGLRLQ